MARILVTGGTGFIGTALVKKLHELGHNLKLLVRESSNTEIFKDLKNIDYAIGDIRDYSSLEKAVNNIDAIYHLAAYTGIWAKDNSIYYDVNVKGTQNVANIALHNNLDLFYVSSFTALGPTPPEPVDETHEKADFFMEYEKSKFQAKKLVKELKPKGLKVVIFYPGIVYGPGDFNVFGRMLYDVMRGKLFPLGACPGKGESIACFSFVNDTANALTDVLNREDLLGEDFILGGENIKFREYLNLISKIGRNKKARKFPFPIAMMYAWLLEVKAKINKKTPFLTRPTLRAIKYNRAYSSKKAIEKFGYKITPLDEGLEETITWYKNYNQKEKNPEEL